MSSLIKQSNPAQSGQLFSFLAGNGDNATRSVLSGPGPGPSFSQMLKGQLDAGTIDRSATATRARSTAESARPAPQSTAAPAREPQRPASRNPESGRSTTAERNAGTATNSTGDKTSTQTETASETTTASAPTTSTDSATATPSETAPAAPGDNPLAALPATIAALLQKTAAPDGTDASATTDTLTGDVLAGSADAMTDDTLAKSLQNSPLAVSADTTEAAGTQTAARFQLAAEPAAQGNRPLNAQPTLSVDASSGLPGATTLPGLRHHVTQPTVPQLPVTTPAGQQAWAEDVGNRVMWMVGRAESKAELVLTPPSLGKLEITISLNGDQTTAQFVAASQAARDALEQAMPKLREILAQSGISLGQADVSTSGEQQAAQDEAARRSNGGHGGNGFGDDAGSEAAPAQRWVRQAEGMVDTFA